MSDLKDLLKMLESATSDKTKEKCDLAEKMVKEKFKSVNLPGWVFISCISSDKEDDDSYIAHIEVKDDDKFTLKGLIHEAMKDLEMNVSVDPGSLDINFDEFGDKWLFIFEEYDRKVHISYKGFSRSQCIGIIKHNMDK